MNIHSHLDRCDHEGNYCSIDDDKDDYSYAVDCCYR